MKKPIKIKAFTLLELMVCLALIGLLGALIGIKGIDLLSHHRFRSNLQTWLLDIGRAQILAMHQKCDIVCTLKKTQEGKYQAILASDSPLFSPSIYNWQDVSKITFQGKSIDIFSITFSPSGRIFPQGVLKITPSREEKDAIFLDLSYPVIFHTNPIVYSSIQAPFFPEKEKKLPGVIDK